MTSFRDINTKYFTKQIANEFNQEDIEETSHAPAPPNGIRHVLDPNKLLINAVIEQRFNNPMIDKGDDWLLAVERFEVSMNGVPYYRNDVEEGYIAGPLLNKSNVGKLFVFNDISLAESLPIPLIRPAYSLVELIEVINISLEEAIKNGQLSNAFMGIATFIEFSVSPRGYVQMTLDDPTWFEKFYLSIPPFMFAILGIRKGSGARLPSAKSTPQNKLPDVSIFVSDNPRWDVGGFPDHIRIYANLGTVSDYVSNAQSDIITDLSVSASRAYGTSTSIIAAPNSGEAENRITGNNFAPTQKIVYAPDRLRWINISDPSPILNMRFEARFVLPNGRTERIIQLPPGCSFGIKIAFYSRK